MRGAEHQRYRMAGVQLRTAEWSGPQLSVGFCPSQSRRGRIVDSRQVTPGRNPLGQEFFHVR